MGASNFSRGNTSKVYAVLMNQEETFKECTECGHKHYDYEYTLKDVNYCAECNSEDLTENTEYNALESWEIDEFKEYVRETAENKVKSLPYEYRFEDECGNERDYTSFELFSFRTSKMYGDISVDIKIVGQLVGAYYEGASLDFEVYIDNGGEWVALENGYYTTTEADILNDLFAPQYEHYYSDMNQGLRRILMNKAVKWAEKEVKELKETIEQVFEKVSQPLNVVATFSNGETIYEKV